MALKTVSKTPWATLAKAAKDAKVATGGKSWNARNVRKPGDTLMGTVGDSRETVTAYGPGRVMEIVTPEGEKESLFLSKVLENAIKGAGGFEKGDSVFIKFIGIPAGKRYMTYAVGKL